MDETKTDPRKQAETFGIDRLKSLLRAGEDWRAWAFEQGYGVAGDSAPPPIPLGIAKGDPAGVRFAIEQALDVQESPPPEGKIWHIAETDKDDVQALGGVALVRLMESLKDEPELERDEHGQVARSLLPIAACLSVVLAALAYSLT